MEKASSRLRDFLRTAPIESIRRASAAVGARPTSGYERLDLADRLRGLTGQHMDGFRRMQEKAYPPHHTRMLVRPIGKPEHLPTYAPDDHVFRGGVADLVDQMSDQTGTLGIARRYASPHAWVANRYVRKGMGYGIHGRTRPAVMHVMDVKDLRFAVHPERKGVPHYTVQLTTDDPDRIRRLDRQLISGQTHADFDNTPDFEGVINSLVRGKYYRPVRSTGVPIRRGQDVPLDPRDGLWQEVQLRAHPAAARWMADRKALMAEPTSVLAGTRAGIGA